MRFLLQTTNCSRHNNYWYNNCIKLYINTSEVVDVVVDQTEVHIEMIIFLRTPHYYHHREQF